MMKETYTKLGSWVFLVGILISIIVGSYQAHTLETGGDFFESNIGSATAWFLATIGLIVGILTFLKEGTVTEKEVPFFLWAAIALVVMGGVFRGWNTILSPYLGALLAGISMSLSIFVAPAIIIIAIKVIWDVGKDR